MMLKSIDNKQLSLLNNLKVNKICSLVRAKASCQGWDNAGKDYFDCLVIESELVSSIT